MADLGGADSRGPGGGGASRRPGDETSEQESKNLRRKQERRYWERLASVLPEMHVRVWKALHKHLQRYYKLLEYRSRLVDSAVDLQKQNDELKTLLDQYLGSKVNEDLHIPPTHVIRVVPGAPN